MSEKRFFKSKFTEHIIDKESDKCYPIRDVDGVDELVGLLNEQQATISQLKEENEQLRQQLQEKQEEERVYANEIVKLNKEVKDNQFLRLGNDY